MYACAIFAINVDMPSTNTNPNFHSANSGVIREPSMLTRKRQPDCGFR